MIFLSILYHPPAPPAFRPKPDDRFVAYRKLPRMFDARGRKLDPRRLFLHELTLVGRGRDGTLHFLLDAKVPVWTRSPRTFSPNALLRVVRTKALAALRRRYEGHLAWTYGQLGAYRMTDSSGSMPRWTVRPGAPLRIARIYGLADENPSIGDDPDFFLGNDSEATHRPALGDGPYLAVFDPQEGVTEGRRGCSPHSVGPPFLVIGEGWLFERAFSLRPPPPKVRRKVQALTASGKPEYAAIPGLTHLEVAWFYGWPKKPTPLARMLKEPSWIYNEYAIIRFEGDRAVSYALGTPH